MEIQKITNKLNSKDMIFLLMIYVFEKFVLRFCSVVHMIKCLAVKKNKEARIKFFTMKIANNHDNVSLGIILNCITEKYANARRKQRRRSASQ